MADRRAEAGVTVHRFFLPPASIQGGEVRFSGNQARQIRSVLRLRPGDRVIVLDGTGKELVVRLQTVVGETVGTVEEVLPNPAEPRTRLTLYQGLLKGSKLELVLQKCTEVGVSAFVPVTTARAVSGQPNEARQRRFEAIVREAAEQSGRGRLPDVHPAMPFGQALQTAAAGGPVVLPWEEQRGLHIDEVPLGPDEPVGLFIGPEGGFTPEEVNEARAAGAYVVTLGKRILRAETAAVVASALVLRHTGDLG